MDTWEPCICEPIFSLKFVQTCVIAYDGNTGCSTTNAVLVVHPAQWSSLVCTLTSSPFSIPSACTNSNNNLQRNSKADGERRMRKRGLCVFDFTSEIIWINSYFRLLVPQRDLMETNVTEYTLELVQLLDGRLLLALLKLADTLLLHVPLFSLKTKYVISVCSILESKPYVKVLWWQMF